MQRGGYMPGIASGKKVRTVGTVRTHHTQARSLTDIPFPLPT